MKDAAFWIFFVFGTVTVLAACGGAGFALWGGAGDFEFNVTGLLLLFLGVSLALMLGCLVVIRQNEKTRGLNNPKGREK